MKKFFFIIVLFLIFLSGVFFVKNKSSGRILGTAVNNTIDYQLNNKTYKLLVANTPDEWERGLMYFRKLDMADGMIFIFKDKNFRHFWNKNTYLDLDIYWLDNDKVVGQDYLPSIEKSKDLTIVSSPQAVDRVIELVK